MERKSCCWFYLNRNFRIAVMILLVTVIYYLSIIPWCLAINDIIRYNPYIHYSFLLNNTINPLIYGFLNPYFRNCCLYIFKSMFSSMSNKVYNLVHGWEVKCVLEKRQKDLVWHSSKIVFKERAVWNCKSTNTSNRPLLNNTK